MTDRQTIGLWVSAGVAAILWVASGVAHTAVIRIIGLSSSIGGVFPATQQHFVWSQPQPWPILAVLVGAIAVVGVHRSITGWIAVPGRRRLVFIAVWFAAVAAGGLVGLASDIGTIIFSLPDTRLQTLLNGLGQYAGVGAYWGLIQGWIPAVVLVWISKPGDKAAVPKSISITLFARGTRALIAAVVVLALVAVTVVGVAGQRAARVASAQQVAIENGADEDSNALPDPYAEGTPVPSIAPDSTQPAADWCTPDQAHMLLGSTDGLTGHRILPIRLMNFSDAPCVVNGYPDIAFADQNDNAMAVTIEQGDSFFAIDPGAQRVEIPAGESAVTYLGWDAIANQGQFEASTLYGASFAGEVRGSWPLEADISEGSTVAVTAWLLENGVDDPHGTQ